MGKFRYLAVAALAVSASVLAMEAANAATNIVSGTIWETSTAVAQNAVLSNVPASSPNYATFMAPSDPLNFSSTATANGYTLGGFLASGGATGVTYFGSAASTDALDSTIMEVMGTVTVTAGEQFQVGHDDGFSIMIGGWSYSDPGPTSYALTTITYTGASGNQPFKLAFGECCGPPAYLTVDLPLSSAIPEASTWAMMLAGFGFVGFAAFRRRKGPISILSA